MGLAVPRHRSVRAGHRCSGGGEARSGGHPPVLLSRAAARHTSHGGDETRHRLTPGYWMSYCPPPAMSGRSTRTISTILPAPTSRNASAPAAAQADHGAGAEPGSGSVRRRGEHRSGGAVAGGALGRWWTCRPPVSTVWNRVTHSYRFPRQRSRADLATHCADTGTSAVAVLIQQTDASTRPSHAAATSAPTDRAAHLATCRCR